MKRKVCAVFTAVVLVLPMVLPEAVFHVGAAKAGMEQGRSTGGGTEIATKIGSNKELMETEEKKVGNGTGKDLKKTKENVDGRLKGTGGGADESLKEVKGVANESMRGAEVNTDGCLKDAEGDADEGLKDAEGDAEEGLKKAGGNVDGGPKKAEGGADESLKEAEDDVDESLKEAEGDTEEGLKETVDDKDEGLKEAEDDGDEGLKEAGDDADESLKETESNVNGSLEKTESNTDENFINKEEYQISQGIRAEYTEGTLTVEGQGNLPGYRKGEARPFEEVIGQITDVVICEGITSVGDRFLQGGLNVASLEFPQTLTRIGAYAFEQNVGLEEVEMPDGVRSVGEAAFRGDIHLTIVGKKRFGEIGEAAFEDCWEMGQSGMPIGKTGAKSFRQCSNRVLFIPRSNANRDGEKFRYGEIYLEALDMSRSLEGEETTMAGILAEKSDRCQREFSTLRNYFAFLLEEAGIDTGFKAEIQSVPQKDGNKDGNSTENPKNGQKRADVTENPVMRAVVRNAATAAELVSAISASADGDIINITGNITAKNIRVNKNLTIRASGGTRAVTPANGNEVAAFIITANSKVTFASDGDYLLYIGGESKGSGDCVTSSNVRVLNGSSVVIKDNVYIRNSRLHGVYGDVNTTITLNGGHVYNSAGIKPAGNGLASYGTILMKSGQVANVIEGIHINGGSIEMTGGEVTLCSVGVAVRGGSGDYTEGEADAWLDGGYIYDNEIGVGVYYSYAEASDNLKVGYKPGNVKSTNTKDSFFVNDKNSYLEIMYGVKSYCTAAAGVDNYGTLSIEGTTNKGYLRLEGNSTFGIVNRATGTTCIQGGIIDGAKTGLCNLNYAELSNNTCNIAIRNCTVRGVKNGDGDHTKANFLLYTKGHLDGRTLVQDNGMDAPGGGIYNEGICSLVGKEDSGGLYIRNNKGSNGAGIYNKGTLSCIGNEAITISGNAAIGNGGGIYNDGKLTIGGGTISGNQAAYGAGVFNASSMEMTVGSISANISVSSGGAVYNTGTAKIDGVLKGNTAGTFGGGVMNKSSLIITGGEISGNTAKANRGGAICNDGSTQASLGITDGRIFGNQAQTGAGIEQHGGNGTMKLSGGWVYGNTTGGYGIYNETGSCTLTGRISLGCSSRTNKRTFVSSNNTSGNIYNGLSGILNLKGVGDDWVYLAGTSSYNINNEGKCTISSDADNHPVITGAAAKAVRNTGTLTMTVGEILGARVGISNESGTANLNGGRIYECTEHGVLNSASIQMGGMDIYSNATAANGAGVYNTGTFVLHGGRIVANTATGNGGGIYNGGKLTVNSGTVGSNQAAYGAGVYNVSSMGMTGGSITTNTSANSGGAVYNTGTAQINGTLKGNIAETFGGGIMNKSSLTITGGEISGNIAKENRGGAICNDGGTKASLGVTGGWIFGNQAQTGAGIEQHGGAGTMNLAGGWIYGNTTGGYGIYNETGSCTLTGSVSMGCSSWTNIETFTSSSNTSGNVYNGPSGTMNLKGTGDGWVYLAGSAGYNVNNGGSCTISMDASGHYPVLTGTAAKAIRNTGALTMAAGEVLGARVGISNESGTANLNGGSVYNCTEHGVVNNAAAQMGGADIHDNTTAVSGAGVYNTGTFVLNSGYVQSNKQTTSAGGGGAGVDNTGVFNMKGGIIQFNSSAGAGGGVRNGGIFTMTEGDLISNTAVGNGGGIYSAPNNTLTITGGMLFDNSSKGSGGAIAADTSAKGGLKLQNCIISSNSADVYGGGVYTKTDVELSEASIIKNSAGQFGGGIFLNGANGAMGSGSIAGNTAGTGGGGGMYINYNTFHLTGGEILDNHADKNRGGGLGAFGGTIEVSGGKVTQNTAFRHGGISVEGDGSHPDAKAVLTGGEVTLNTAATTGGGIGNNTNGEILLQPGTGKTLKVTGNKANDGGGVHNQGEADIYGGTIRDNAAQTGKAVYQAGILKVYGSPTVKQDIFLAPEHVILVERISTSDFEVALGEADTFESRVLANYQQSVSGQTGHYSLETATKGYAEKKKVEIKDRTGGEYPYQVYLGSMVQKVKINYLANPTVGEETKVSGKMESDIVPITEKYRLKENGFTYQRHTYRGWDPYGEKQLGHVLFYPGQIIIPDNDLNNSMNSAHGLQSLEFKSQTLQQDTISVASLVQAYGVKTASLENDPGYDYEVDLNAIWDEAPTLDTTILEFYEGETVTKGQLLDEVFLSEYGARDTEDSYKAGENDSNKPHLLDNEVKITGIQYNPIRNGYRPDPNTDSFAGDMPAGYLLDTYNLRGMARDESVDHTLTFSVRDSAGNVTTKNCAVRVLYNNYPSLRVPQNLMKTAEELMEHPLTEGDLLEYASANDVEDDAAKYKGLKDKEGNLVNIQEKVRVAQVLDGARRDIWPEDIHDVGDYYVTYSVTDRFGKETLKTMKLTIVEPAQLTAHPVRYVRFISLKHLDTLDPNSRWDKEELRVILENETPVATHYYTHEQVEEIKELMKGLRTKGDFENAVNTIKEKYMKEN